MKIRKLLSSVLALALVLSFLPTVAFAAAGDYEVKVNFVKEDSYPYNGQAAMRIDLVLNTNGAPVNSIISALLMYDADQFNIIHRSNGSVMSQPANFGTSIPRNQVAANSYVNDDAPYTEVAAYVYTKMDQGVLLLQADIDAADTTEFTSETCLFSIYLGLKDSTTWADLTEDSIRFATAAETAPNAQTSVVGLSDSSGTFYEWRRSSGAADTLTTAPVIEIEGFSFATPPTPTANLTVTAPTFADVAHDYTTVATKDITIANTGDGAATISDVTVSNTKFVISGSGSSVPAGGSITSWKIAPADSLASGTHTATITVTYDGGATATKTVSFKVNADSSAAAQYIQFDIQPVPVVPASAPVITPFSMVGSSVTELYPNETYQMKIGITTLQDVSSLSFPLVFNKNVVEVTGVSLGDAFAPNWYIAIADGLPAKKYQAGSSEFSLSDVNTDGRILLEMNSTDGIYRDFDPAFNPANDSEVFFIVEFKLKDGVAVGASPDFKSLPYGDGTIANWGSYGVATYWGESAPDPDFGDTVPELKGLTVSITNPTVAAKTLKVEIVDPVAGTAAALKSTVPTNKPVTVTNTIGWSTAGGPALTATEKEVTWSVESGGGNIVELADGTATYTPATDYVGPVTVKVASDVDATVFDTYTFNVVDLQITNPTDDTVTVNKTTTPTTPVVAEFKNVTPTDDSAVVWTATKDGTPVTGTDLNTLLGGAGKLTALDPVFTPDSDGTYVLTITNGTYGSDTITFIVSETLDEYILKGTAGLRNKTTSIVVVDGVTAFNPRTNYHEGIKVELVNKTTELVIAIDYTDATGAYELKVDPSIDIKGTDYFIRFSRVGNVDGTLRNESYLFAILPLNVTNTIPAGATKTVSTTRVGLYAGAFVAPNEDKATITDADIQAIKGFVGLKFGQTGYDQAMDINEYDGINGGDLNIVVQNKTAATRTLPVATISP